MKPAKPHFLIRLIDGIADRAFRTAAAATPVIGGAVVGMFAQADSPGEYDEQECALAAMTGYFPDGSSCYSDVRCLKYIDEMDSGR